MFFVVCRPRIHIIAIVVVLLLRLSTLSSGRISGFDFVDPCCSEEIRCDPACRQMHYLRSCCGPYAGSIVFVRILWQCAVQIFALRQTSPPLGQEVQASF
jgi:hypothetical protein